MLETSTQRHAVKRFPHSAGLRTCKRLLMSILILLFKNLFISWCKNFDCSKEVIWNTRRMYPLPQNNLINILCDTKVSHKHL
jgi:hypothetical protein